MENGKLVRMLPTLAAKKKALRDKRTKLRRLERSIENLEYNIERLEDVTEVYDGVALKLWKVGSMTVTAVDPDLERTANIYQNAHNGWTWGFHTSTGKFGSREKWHGAEFPDYDEVLKMAKDWVVHGTKPHYEAFQPLEEVLVQEGVKHV